MISSLDPEQSYQQFMQLMVSQIQYQDPLNPVSQENMTAQLAQISTVSGINQLNVQFSEMLNLQTLFDGAQLIDQHVEYTSPITGEPRTGQITQARSADGQIALTVNAEQIGLSDVSAVISGSQAS